MGELYNGQPTVHTYRVGTRPRYRGYLGWTDPTGRQRSVVCPHLHRTTAAAQRCADHLHTNLPPTQRKP